MTENTEEIAELQRAHAAQESRVDTILPTLCTKADLEAMSRHLTDEMTRRFDIMNQRFDTLQKTMIDGFNRIWLWIAGTLVTVLIGVIGFFSAVLARQPAPLAAPSPPVVYQLYPPGYTAVPAPQLAPPSQP